jgi:site-specific recombinase XerD
MSTLAPTLQGFFTDRLSRQRRASAAYRDAIKLLLAFAWQQTGKAPAQLDVADLDTPLIGAFLDHLETGRGNSTRTRNARLAAIHALFSYAALRHPEDAAVIQRVLAILRKRFSRTIITYLTEQEITTLLAAPDHATWTGRRDHAMLALACQTGLRAAELTQLAISDVHLGTGAHVSCLGKGRKQRITPLTATTAATLSGWLTERGGQPAVPCPVRHPAQPRRSRTPGRQVRRDCRTVLPGPARQENLTAYPAALRRDAPPNRQSCI